MPLLTGKQQIAIKQESTAGTAAVLDNTNVVLHNGVAEFEPDFVMTPRDAMTASLSPRGSVRGVKTGTIRWKMFLRGSYNHTTGAAAAPAAGTEADWHIPFLGCGATNTISGSNPNEQNSYKPSSTTISDETTGAYCTVALYQDGKRYQIIGAVGNCVLRFQNNQPVVAEFEFRGRFTVPSDTGLLSSVVYPAPIEPAFGGAAVSILSYTSPFISALTLDFGNEISVRPSPDNTSGVHTCQIVRRNPRGTLDPEETLGATKNWINEWSAGTLGAIATGTFPTGGTNYNQLSLNIPNASYVKVGVTDREGIVNAPIEFECRANSDAGEDEWEMIQT